MEIESYEPYHIGNKLNPATNFDVLKDKLRNKLRDNGYDVPENKIQGLTPTNEILGRKETIRIEFNNAAQAINVIGDSPEKVTNHYNELMAILENLEYEIENTITFTEILAVIVAKSDGKPTDMLQRFMKNSVNTISFKDIDKLSVIGVRIAGETGTDKKLFTLAIEPSPTSTNSKFILTLHYRPENKENIKTFYEDLDEDVIKLVEKLV